MCYLSFKAQKLPGFPLEVKWFQNTATYQKLQGGVPSTPPPPLPPLYLNLHVRQRVNLQTQALKPTWLTINVCVVTVTDVSTTFNQPLCCVFLISLRDTVASAYCAFLK